MPTNLTDVSSFDTATAPVGSDIRNAASVQAALQPQANRTRFLFDRTAPLADIAALKAIASPADGLVRHVKATGIYVFDLASVATEALPFIVAPNAGSGRWVFTGHVPLTAYAADKRSGKADTVASALTLTGTVTTSAGGRVVHGDGDYPDLAVGHGGRTVVRRIAPGAALGQSVSTPESGDKSFEHVIKPLDPTLVTVRGGYLQWAAVNTANSAPFARGLFWDLTPHLVNGATLDSVAVILKGASGHSNLPDKPRVLVTRYVPGTVQPLRASGDITDPAADLTAYQADHTATYTCTQNNVVDKATYIYCLSVTNEGFADALAGLQVRGITLTMTITDLRTP